ncbi:MAG: hypothetical protein IKK70_03930 [Clostridia bacterium]|nr:hypothetical protein [Clostridia bacterium]
MKKLLAFLLAATMLCAMFVLPSAAADNVNYQEEFKYIETAPKIDGVVKTGEYGKAPIHSYPEDKSQFVDTEHNQYSESDWDFDFYGAWDDDNLYLAWVLNTETHIAIPETDHSGDGVWDSNDYGFMWKFSCVQFILTPGEPKKGETSYQVGQYDGDYLEAGLALTENGEQIRIAWCKPVNASSLEVNDWDAVITRDEDAKTTTYEVRIPWDKTGLSKVSNDEKFGFTYAVAAQDYDAKPGMIEWQNGMLTSKDADSAAAISLTGKKIEIVVQPDPPAKEEGEVPAEATDKVQLIIDGVNTAISSDTAYLFTRPENLGGMNTKWSINVLLAPVEGEEGYYTVVESIQGAGEDVVFTSEITDGMLCYSAHALDDTSAGAERRNAAANLAVGTKVALFGVDLEEADTLYTNSMLYVVSEASGDTSGAESSDVESSDVESSVVESSDVESSEVSEESSKAESSAAASTSSEAEEGGNTGLIIGIIVAVVAIIAVVVVVVLKKKKQ